MFVYIIIRGGLNKRIKTLQASPDKKITILFIYGNYQKVYI